MSDSWKDDQARVRKFPGEPNPLIQRHDGVLLSPDQERGDVQLRNPGSQYGSPREVDLPSRGNHGPAVPPVAERLPIALHEFGVHTVLFPDDSPKSCAEKETGGRGQKEQVAQAPKARERQEGWEPLGVHGPADEYQAPQWTRRIVICQMQRGQADDSGSQRVPDQNWRGRSDFADELRDSLRLRLRGVVGSRWGGRATGSGQIHGKDPVSESQCWRPFPPEVGIRPESVDQNDRGIAAAGDLVADLGDGWLRTGLGTGGEDLRPGSGPGIALLVHGRPLVHGADPGGCASTCGVASTGSGEASSRTRPPSLATDAARWGWQVKRKT